MQKLLYDFIEVIFLRPSEYGFTPRQYMVNRDFEFFHNIDDSLMEVEYHNHDFYEIYFFISGKVTYIIEGKTYLLKPDDIILVNNKELHKPIIRLSEAYERIVIWVNPDFISKQSTDGTNLSMCFDSSSKSKYNLIRPSTELKESIMMIVEKLERVCTAVSYGSNVLKEIYMTELLIYLNKAYLNTHDEEIENDIHYNEAVNNIVQYINENLPGNLTLDILASKFYKSKYHLEREFKKSVGYTLHDYIQQKRLIMAKILLRGNIPVTEVYLRCGFGDYSNFIRSFKKSFGLPPKKYSKNYFDG